MENREKQLQQDKKDEWIDWFIKLICIYSILKFFLVFICISLFIKFVLNNILTRIFKRIFHKCYNFDTSLYFLINTLEIVNLLSNNCNKKLTKYEI